MQWRRAVPAGVCVAAVSAAALWGAPIAIADAHHTVATPATTAATAAIAAKSGTGSTTAASAQSATALTPAAATQLAQQMQAAIQSAEPGTQVGIDVTDTTTGATLVGLDTGQQFYTASVVKLLIALDAFDSQGWQPDSDTAAEVSQMLSASDDDIADGLWDANGGNDIVNRMVDLIGLTGTQAPTDPDEWGETLMTPADVVSVYHYITTVVPEPSRDILMNALGGAEQTAADGTDQFFGIPDGLTGDSWAIKQGWMTLDDETTLDTTGLVGTGAGQPLRYAVVVLTSQPAGVSWTDGGDALTAAIAPLQSVLEPTTAATQSRA